MIYVSALICIIGAIVYVLSTDPKNAAPVLALHMFWVGLLAFLLTYSGIITIK